MLQTARALQPAAWSRVCISSPRAKLKSTGYTWGFKTCWKSSGDIWRVERAKADSALFVVFTGSGIQHTQSHNHAWDLRDCLWLKDSWGPLYEASSSPVLLSKSDHWCAQHMSWCGPSIFCRFALICAWVSQQTTRNGGEWHLYLIIWLMSLDCLLL